MFLEDSQQISYDIWPRNGHMAFPIIFGRKWSCARDAGKRNIWLSTIHRRRRQGRRKLGRAVG